MTDNMKRTKRKRSGKVIRIAARRREAVDLVKFIDAHGGKLAPFRGYGAAQRAALPEQVRPENASPVEAPFDHHGSGDLGASRYNSGVLAFETQPDPIFRAILDEALANMRGQLHPFVETYTPTSEQLIAEDETYREFLYERLAQLFTRTETLGLIDRLRAALDDDQLYQMTDYHRLVLHDALDMFCDLHNGHQLGADGRVGPYIIDAIDLGDILNVYFPDTDFLMGPTLLRAEENQPGEFRFTEAAWRIAARLRPRPEDLVLRPTTEADTRMEELEPRANGWPTSGYVGPYPLREAQPDT